MQAKTISIILPLYNEEENVEKLIRTVREIIAPGGLGLEFILVDDGSTDGTWARCKELAKKHKDLKGIRFSRNFGKEAALAAGLDMAAGDAAITMDADFQHPPDLITEMIRCWAEEGYDLVEAYKINRGDEGFLYKLCSKFYYKIMDRLSGFRFEGASDFKLLDKKVISAWKQFNERNLFFRGLCSWLGFNHKEIPLKVQKRESGKTKWTLISLARLAITGITSFSRVPLYFIAVTGLLFFVFATIMSIRAFILKFQGVVLDGFTTLVLINLFTGSIVILSISVLGLYVGRIYKEVKMRPRYIIKSTLDEDS